MADTPGEGSIGGELPDDPFGGNFDDELEGLLGNKAKVAAIVTRLASARLLAAFCILTDIKAGCIDDEMGAVAILHDLDGDAPEQAAKGLTVTVKGLSVVLAVNRADKLEATVYKQGAATDSLAPPVLFASTAGFVEDVLLGITSLADLASSGTGIVDSTSMDADQAMQVIRHNMRPNPGSFDQEDD